MPPASSHAWLPRFFYDTQPTSPEAGDVWVYPVDDTNGVEWQFRCHNPSDTNPWRFIGGPPLTFPTHDPDSVLSGLTSTGKSTGEGLAVSYDSSTTITCSRGGTYVGSGSYLLQNTGTVARNVSLGLITNTSAGWSTPANNWTQQQIPGGSALFGHVAVAATRLTVAAGFMVAFGLASDSAADITVRWNAGGIVPVRVA